MQTPSKLSDPLRKCNNHVLNSSNLRLSVLAITVTFFVGLGSPPLPTFCFGCHFYLNIKIILRCDNQHSTTGTQHVDFRQQGKVSRQKVFQGNHKMQLPLFLLCLTHRAQVTWEST